MIHLGEYQPLLTTDEQCYDVMWVSAGHLLVAREGGMDVVDVNNGKLLKSVPLQGQAFTISTDGFVILVGTTNELMTHTTFVTLDMDYKKIGEWTMSPGGGDFTICGDKVYVTGIRIKRESGGIAAYSLSGKELPDSTILWNGRAHGIKNLSSEFIIFGDPQQNKVYKRRVFYGQSDTVWSIDVIKPEAISVAENGLIWVWSDSNYAPVILTSDGSRHQPDMKNTKFSVFTTISGILVHDDHFYITHKTGMGRFPILHE